MLVTPENRYAHVFAGAGIVSASEPAREYDETELKMQSVAMSLAVV